MSSVDAPVVVAQLQALSGTLGGLGNALEQAAPSGGFAAVLDAVQAQMDAIGEAASPASPATPFVSTAGLLETADGAGSLGGSPNGPTGQQVVAEAEQLLGVPYQWGGSTPSTGFDCSGLVQYVFGQLGVSLPRTSEEQATVGTPVASLAQAQPGDLVFYEPGPGGPGHVGIYIGNGQIIDAPHTGTVVQVQPVGQPSEIRRVLASPAPTGGTIPASLDVPPALVPLFEQEGAAFGVPPSLLAAVAKQESGFNPQAVSSAGAQGLMQLMPSTAAGLGVDPFDPQQAVAGAAQLLGSYLQQYNGSVPLALAAYNAGPGAVAQYGGVPPYAQTQQYVADILSSLGAGT